MIRTADLKAQTRRELATLAKNYGVPGWHGMKKAELIEAIGKVQRRLRRKSASNGQSSGGQKNQKNTVSKGKSKPSAAPKSSRKSKSSAATAGSRTANASARSSKSRNSPNARGSSSPRRAANSRNTASSSRTSSSRSTSSSRNSSPAKNSHATRSSKATAGSKTKSLSNSARSTAKSNSTTKSKGGKQPPQSETSRVSAKTARIRAQVKRRRESIQRNKDLSTATLVGGSAVKNGSDRTRADGPHRDRVVLLVRDAYWLQANWEITRASVQRAQSALAERWHTATPVLRVLSVGDVNSNRAESIERDITIHGGVNNWYIDVDEPPRRFRVLVGYLADNGDFYTLCRSNVVETPQPGECERLDEHWRDIAEDYERIYSLSGGYDTDGGDLKDMFEERLHRTMPLRGEKGRTVSEPSLLRETKLPLQADAELIVYGKTSANASVMVANRPVKLQADGSFTVRLQLPDKRQVLPVTAESRDGLRQRTTVIAVERNTKVMETVELEDRL